MSERENITDILCIGCQKGSTSWLHSVLNFHPQTWSFADSEPITSTDKEAHFWDWNHHRGVAWYRQLMTPPRADCLTMDFTPEYAYLSDSQIAECKSLNPSAKVIYILRDPLARAVSALRMHILWHYGNGYSTPLALNDRFFEFAKEARLTLHGQYLKNIAAWRVQYPDMMLINYEDFHTNREDSVAEIFKALDLEQDAITGAAAKGFSAMMNKRVWASEQFPMERSVLMFLQGLTWETRVGVDSALNMRFTEGARLLEA
ncbi:sulfotransferase domain-containing protein [Pararhodobacter sp.]|uniref:sulfotransferase domain-containing protein n=1 Tax=Pararhodobacter sp. TaxID=2127056 RepID=UPI002AFE2748|nr:sulfotransferase domain-containing protein [Pararhodobacter sp.]